MKQKFILQLITVLFIGAFCGAVVGGYINHQRSYRPFEFRGGFRHSGGGYIQSTSHVLVNAKHYDLEELYQNIYEEFVLMNGTHDEITFFLYDTIENLHTNNYFSERSFLKSPD